MNFSAKKLLTMSASQLIYLNNHQGLNNKTITPQILSGQRYQQDILNKLNESACYLDEMGGVYTDGRGNNVYFSHDIVKNNGTEIFETKYNNEPALRNDYLMKSALQCAVYDTLTRFSSPLLHKSKFAQNGFNNATIELDSSYQYFLSIGNSLFKIKLLDPYPILDFIENKIAIIEKGDYNEARRFDSIWKGNEYKILRKCFRITEIAHPYLI